MVGVFCPSFFQLARRPDRLKDPTHITSVVSSSSFFSSRTHTSIDHQANHSIERTYYNRPERRSFQTTCYHTRRYEGSCFLRFAGLCNNSNMELRNRLSKTSNPTKIISVEYVTLPSACSITICTESKEQQSNRGCK